MENAFYVEPPYNTRVQRLGIELILLQPVAIGTLIRPIDQSVCAIAIGQYAGYYEQGECAVAIGEYAGHTSQGDDALALAPKAGAYYQGFRAVALGTQAGQTLQRDDAVAVGAFAGAYNQGSHALALGDQSGHFNQGSYAIAIGHQAGKTNQPEKSVVINATGVALSTVTKSQALYIAPVATGSSTDVLYYNSTSKEVTYAALPSGSIPSGDQPSEYLFWNGSTWAVGTTTIRLGRNAGQVGQGAYAIALGYQAGMTNQPEKSIVINATGAALDTVSKTQACYVAPIASATSSNLLFYDPLTKEISYGARSSWISNGTTYSEYLYWDPDSSTWAVGGGTIRLGAGAGYTQQQTSAIALGLMAGHSNQGSYAIAIGREAGKTNQPEKSIVINATGMALGTVTKSQACYVAPIASGTSSHVLYYDPTSREITYATPTYTGSLSLETKTYAYYQARDAVAAKVMFTDCADKDAFYRLRVSEPNTLFEGSTIYDANMLFFDNDLTANASITGPTGAAMTLSVSAASTANQYAARQTHFYAHYQPGKSLCAYFSFCFGAAVSGITRRVGLYDVNNTLTNLPLNGVVLEQTLAGLEWRVYQGDGVNYQSAAQASWNVDPLNGSGPSGITLDPTNNLLGFVDLEWLGVGRVRVGFFVNGVPVICHTFNNSNFTVPYLNNPLLPIRYEIRKTDNSAATATFRTVCCTILSEGGYDPIGINRTFQSPALSLSGNQVKSCLALRLRDAYPRAILSPLSVEIVSNLGGNAIAFYSVYLWRPSSSSVPSGASWTNIDTYSMAEYTATDLYSQMTADTGIYTLIEKASVTFTTRTAFSTINNALLIAQSSVNRSNRDIILIVIDNNSTGTNRTYSALFSWKES
jgi:hypothetical protein